MRLRPPPATLHQSARTKRIWLLSHSLDAQVIDPLFTSFLTHSSWGDRGVKAISVSIKSVSTKILSFIKENDEYVQPLYRWLAGMCTLKSHRELWELWHKHFRITNSQIKLTRTKKNILYVQHHNMSKYTLDYYKPLSVDISPWYKHRHGLNFCLSICLFYCLTIFIAFWCLSILTLGP